MYLARAFLNPISRAVRADLADAVSLHRTVMHAFPDDTGPAARKQHDVLHRVDEDAQRGRCVLLVQSATCPDFTRVPPDYFLDLREDFDLSPSATSDNPAVREIAAERARIAAGDRFAFRLRANTTKKILTKTGPDGKRRNGKRVPVRSDDERLAWLARRAEKDGFGLEAVRVTEVPARSGGVHRNLTLAGAIFEGHLQVTDPDAFRAALAAGIGPGKAFGFGLLSIQRAR
jgi:CRISPR system Cascade subunit CasE